MSKSLESERLAAMRSVSERLCAGTVSCMLPTNAGARFFEKASAAVRCGPSLRIPFDLDMTHGMDFMLRLREALAACWDKQTAYLAAEQPGNPALGQCYPTSHVVQHYYPDTEIVKGIVCTGETTNVHFWNGLRTGDDWYHIDLSWQQFPAESIVQEFVVLNRFALNDSEATVRRCALLLQRVDAHLYKHRHRTGT